MVAPGLLAGPECGCAVAFGDMARLVHRFTDIWNSYVDDRASPRHARDAHTGTVQFAWQAKASKLMDVYEWVSGRRSVKPRSGVEAARPEEEEVALYEA